MNFLNEKKTTIVLFSVVIISLIFAWVLELGFGMEPCSLCLLQRFGLYIASVFLLLKIITDYLLNKQWLKKSLLIGSLLGIMFSLTAGLRQTYIQLLPEDKIPSCGADLETLLSIVTPFEAVRKVFEGSGECAEKAFVFLGLSLANWATLLFAIFFVINFMLLVKGKYSR